MPADASSLHCPNCGAPADPEARRCPFCKARLGTVSCTACFAIIFDDGRFCPKCGAERVRHAGDAVDAPCPGCGGHLRPLQVGTASLLECAGCDGLWVDAEVFERLCADREAQAAVVHRFSGEGPPAPERVRYRRCPRCETIMNRVNFGRISGTIVDVCRSHGTYLDAGELHRIVGFIHGGGLDRARERQLEELRERERALQDAERRLARERGRTDPHGSLGSRGGLETWRFLLGDD